MTVWQKAANAATTWLENSRKVGPPPAPTPVVVPRASTPAGAAGWATRGNRRLPRSDRRRRDRRGINHGSPYGTDRRRGRDDRQHDRREAAVGTTGIGLTRDYFSQSEARVFTTGTGLAPDLLVRFHD